MMTFLAFLSLAIWIYLLAFHGSFWRSLPVWEAGSSDCRDVVTVVVPARNEAEGIRKSIGSLLAQNYPGPLSIILVDDNSADGTKEIAASMCGDGRLRIVTGRALPSGWTGKLWAVHQGLLQAEAKNADFVLLTDADIEHEPCHVARLVARAKSEELDLVSEMVQLHCTTSAERTLIPAFIFFFQMLYPFRWVNDPKKRLAGAAGGTMLVSRSALDRVQGVSRIRHRLIDDCALAKEVKSTGGRIWLGHTEQAASMRVYTDWREIWEMIARTAYVQLRSSPWLLLGCVAGMGTVYCLPPAFALVSSGAPRLAGMVAWFLMAAAFQPTLRRYHRSPLWGAALPALCLFYLCATMYSAVQYYLGRGGGWKDRVYPQHK